MVHPVVEDARAAVKPGVDAISLESGLAPRVPAAALKRHLPVLPVLVGQFPDASPDLLEILAAGHVAAAGVDLDAIDAAAARGVLQRDIGTSPSPDALVIGQHERQIELPIPPLAILERDRLAREHQGRSPSASRIDHATIPAAEAAGRSADAITSSPSTTRAPSAAAAALAPRTATAALAPRTTTAALAPRITPAALAPTATPATSPAPTVTPASRPRRRLRFFVGLIVDFVLRLLLGLVLRLLLDFVLRLLLDFVLRLLLDFVLRLLLDFVLRLLLDFVLWLLLGFVLRLLLDFVLRLLLVLVLRLLLDFVLRLLLDFVLRLLLDFVLRLLLDFVLLLVVLLFFVLLPCLVSVFLAVVLVIPFRDFLECKAGDYGSDEVSVPVLCDIVDDLQRSVDGVDYLAPTSFLRKRHLFLLSWFFQPIGHSGVTVFCGSPSVTAVFSEPVAFPY